MPYTTPEWVEPEVALEYNGVTIYHVYKNDELDIRLTYWFTTSWEEREHADFDVRDIPGWDNKKENIEDTLKLAIDKGWLTQNGLNLDGVP
jgi:hypothetical protein